MVYFFNDIIYNGFLFFKIFDFRKIKIVCCLFNMQVNKYFYKIKYIYKMIFLNKFKNLKDVEICRKIFILKNIMLWLEVKLSLVDGSFLIYLFNLQFIRYNYIKLSF